MRFSTETWPYLGNGERYGKGYHQLLIGSTIRPCHEMEIIDLGWPWRPLRATAAERCN